MYKNEEKQQQNQNGTGHLIESQPIVWKIEWEDNLSSSQNTFFILRVSNSTNPSSWVIHRKYGDFQWLFQIINKTLPGHILPYFPNKHIQTLIDKKITLPEHLRQHFAPKNKEIENFIMKIANNQVLTNSEAWRVFVIQKPQEFRKKQQILSDRVQKERNSQGFSNFYQFFTAKIPWLTPAIQNIQSSSQRWALLTHKTDAHNNSLFQLLSRFVSICVLKMRQAQWTGRQTQSDSIQFLRAKVASSRTNNQTIAREMQQRVVLPMLQWAKEWCQVQQTMQFVGRLLNQIRQQRNKAALDKQVELDECIGEIQNRFEVGWKEYDMRWRAGVRRIDGEFRKIWGMFCRDMGKVWK